MGDLGSKLKQIRLARDFTQQEIAEKLGVSRVYYSQWESNDRRINADQLMHFAKIVGVTLDYFSDQSPQQTLFQTLAELDQFFTSEGISDIDKDKAYRDIMQIYLNSKEINANDSTNNQISTQGEHDKQPEPGKNRI